MPVTNQTDDSAAPPVRQNGQVLVIFALFLVVLVGATALAVDYGSWLKARRDYQNAADAAALAGAAYLTRPLGDPKYIDAREAAWESLDTQLGLGVDVAALAATATASTNNGLGVPAGGYKVWVASPASDAGTKYPGTYSSSEDTVFVWVEAPNQSFFSGIMGIGSKTVPAWATADVSGGRFAVITLRKNGQGPPSAPEDIQLQGGSILNVTNGDVGGNWTMAIGGNPVTTHIQLSSNPTGDTYNVYLNENVSGTSPGQGWLPYQVIDGSGDPSPVKYIQEVPDPRYPAPCLDYSSTGCLVDRGNATASTSVDANGNCPAATGSPDRLPAGRYNKITIGNGKCVVLDPTVGQVAGKENGIYYITGSITYNGSGGLVVGNGVTLVLGYGAQLNMNAGQILSLNSSANGCGVSDCKYAAWTTAGHYSWSAGDTPTPPTYSTPSNPFEMGIAIYKCQSATSCSSGGSASATTTEVNVNAGAGIDYKGVLYAPYDNVSLAGQPNHNGVGQVVAWTLKIDGGVAVNETYDGPDTGVPQLVEPTTSQATYP